MTTNNKNCVYYPCRCEHGVLKDCYGEGDLEAYTGRLNLSVDGWEASPVLSLREAARLLNPHNEFQGGSCNCKSGCKNQRCACKQKGATCSTKCHGGTSCSNCPQIDAAETSTDDEGTANAKSSPAKKRKKLGHSKQDAIDVENTADCPTTNMWHPRLLLSQNDKEILQGGETLTDKHIDAAQRLLKKQFPNIHGLQSPTLQETNQWDVMRAEGVQILNENSNHWVCISTRECPPDTVNVYDSVKTKISTHITRQVSYILHSQADSISFRVMYAQQQTGVSDCGLFAIATATALCFGIPPQYYTVGPISYAGTSSKVF